MAEPFVEVHNLVKTFETPAGPHNVLRGIDFTLNKGEFLGLLGPSGSGKTTFLNMLTGIDKPTAGSVIVNGVDVVQTKQRRLTRWRGRNIGIVFQFFQLLPTLTVVENVMVPMDFADVFEPRERRDRAMALLERLGIADQANKTPDMLSGGQQQRVAIARALVTGPPMLLADEPTGNLDTRASVEIMALFQDLNERQGIIVIFVTHEQDIARHTRRIITIRDGRVMGDEPVADRLITRHEPGEGSPAPADASNEPRSRLL